MPRPGKTLKELKNVNSVRSAGDQGSSRLLHLRLLPLQQQQHASGQHAHQAAVQYSRAVV